MTEIPQERDDDPDRRSPDDDRDKMVTILRTGNASVVAVARSALEAAEIDYAIRGEGLQDLFGLGRIGTGHNPLFGPIEVRVRAEDEEVARGVIAGLLGPGEQGG